MNKSIQIITFLLMLPILGLSQSKISVGLNLNTSMNFLKNEDSQSERGQGYSIGVQAQSTLSERLFLRGGINYQSIKYNNTGQARWPSGDISTYENEATITSIGLPIDLGCNLNSKNSNVTYFLALSGLINVNLENRIEVQGLGNSSETNNEIHKLSSSIGLIGGLEIQVSDKIIVGIEPNFRYGSIFTSPSSKSRMIESGLTLRIRI